MANDLCDTCLHERRCVNGHYCTLLRQYTQHTHIKVCGKYMYQPHKYNSNENN